MRWPACFPPSICLSAFLLHAALSQQAIAVGLDSNWKPSDVELRPEETKKPADKPRALSGPADSPQPVPASSEAAPIKSEKESGTKTPAEARQSAPATKDAKADSDSAEASATTEAHPRADATAKLPGQNSEPTLSPAFDFATAGNAEPFATNLEALGIASEGIVDAAPEESKTASDSDNASGIQYDITEYVKSDEVVKRKMLKAGAGQMVASWYGQEWHKKLTSSGELYNMYSLTAAHKELELGTILKLTNPKNNNTVEVTINNRGPYIEGRDIDLSYAAAQKLGSVDEGVIVVNYEVIGHNKHYDDYLKPSGEKHDLTILVESYQDRQSAEHMKARLDRYYSPVFIEKVRINGVIWYRACVGHFKSRAMAEPIAENLIHRGYDALIIPDKGESVD